MKHFKNEKAFTLIEAVVVMVILAIAAAVAVPSFYGYISSAHDKACTTLFESVFREVQAGLTGERFDDIQVLNDRIYSVFYDSLPAEANEVSALKNDDNDGYELTVENVCGQEAKPDISWSIAEGASSYDVEIILFCDRHGNSFSYEFSCAKRSPAQPDNKSAKALSDIFISGTDIDHGIKSVLDKTDYSSYSDKAAAFFDAVNKKLESDGKDKITDENLLKPVKNYIFENEEYFKKSSNDIIINNYLIVSALNLTYLKYNTDIPAKISYDKDYRPYFYYADMESNYILKPSKLEDSSLYYPNFKNVVILGWTLDGYTSDDNGSYGFVSGQDYKAYALYCDPSYDSEYGGWYIKPDGKPFDVKGTCGTPARILKNVKSGDWLKIS